ncbi:hypothetical protein LJR231_002778 [Phyllobacterium sp. LjRoot231]|uniref:hypothetical protein n=1 Tax=Phyllobacterium sp. LjRoot231 TaxID=3342289 RepID=UPI003ECCE06A
MNYLDTLFDVNSYDLGVSEITRHLHPRDGRKAETSLDQKRIGIKWKASKEGLFNNQTISRNEMNLRRLRQVMELVDHAYTFHPYYHEIYKKNGYEIGGIRNWKDFECLPIVTKDEIISNFDAFKIAVEKITDDIYYSRTSGSSGKILTIMQDSATSDIGFMYYMRHYENMLGRNRLPEEWVYEVYLAPPRITSLEGNFPIFTVSQGCPPDVAVAHLKRLRPSLLTGFPSYFGRMVASGGDLTELGIKAICTNSEASSEIERNRLSRAFNCPVFDEYSSEELYLIATQCQFGEYHLVEDNVHIEAIKVDESGNGICVGTSLINRVMPFIRYEQGDIISISDRAEICPCGNHFRQLHRFSGRADQQLLNTRKNPIDADKVMALYDRVLIPRDAGLAEFRIQQNARGLITVLGVPSGNTREKCANSLECFCRELVVLSEDSNLNVEYQIVPALPLTHSHKRKIITRDVD